MDKLQVSDVKCKCCGACCRRVWIPVSPADLQSRYVRWLSGEGDRNSDIHLIYPMLKFTGKVSKYQSILRYRYRCVHLKRITTEGLYACTIHAHRPKMCRDYPFYGNTIIPGSLEVPKGCVYRNVDNTEGSTATAR